MVQFGVGLKGIGFLTKNIVGIGDDEFSAPLQGRIRVLCRPKKERLTKKYFIGREGAFERKFRLISVGGVVQIGNGDFSFELSKSDGISFKME